MRLKLTRHFTRRWQQRVGGEPTEEMIEKIMKKAIRVQGYRRMMLVNYQFYTTLGIYWHPDLKIILKVDTSQCTAVTVINHDSYKKRRPRRRKPGAHKKRQRRRDFNRRARREATQ